MIKVGQIYKDVDGYLGGVVVVTNVDNKSKEVDYISNNGICFSHDDVYFLKLNRKLIAEYQTWQEAVNSKEFNEKD